MRTASLALAFGVALAAACSENGAEDGAKGESSAVSQGEPSEAPDGDASAGAAESEAPWWQREDPCPAGAALEVARSEQAGDEEGAEDDGEAQGAGGTERHFCRREDGTLEGPYVELYQDGARRREGRWKSGKRDGTWTRWDRSGEVLGRFDMKEGTGVYAAWYDSGQKRREMGFVEGTRHGAWVSWHENGRLKAQGSYARGSRNGVWQMWSREGKLVARQDFGNGPKAGLFGRPKEGAFASMTGTGDLDDRALYGGLRDDVWGEGSKNGSGDATGDTPRVRLGRSDARGELNRKIIRRHIRRELSRIRGCYEKQLLKKPQLRGTVVTQFQISPSGAVAGASATGVDEEVSSCVAETLRSLRFPEPKGGGYVNVRYPFHFESE